MAFGCYGRKTVDMTRGRSRALSVFNVNVTVKIVLGTFPISKTGRKKLTAGFLAKRFCKTP